MSAPSPPEPPVLLGSAETGTGKTAAFGQRVIGGHVASVGVLHKEHDIGHAIKQAVHGDHFAEGLGKRFSDESRAVHGKEMAFLMRIRKRPLVHSPRPGCYNGGLS